MFYTHGHATDRIIMRTSNALLPVGPVVADSAARHSRRHQVAVEQVRGVAQVRVYEASC